MNYYDEIYDELCYRVECGDLTLEEAELINDRAYDKYVIEDGHSKALRRRHNQRARNSEKRFKKAMGYEFGYIDDKGTEYGTVDRGSGRVSIRIPKENIETVNINHPDFQTKEAKKQLKGGPNYTSFKSKNGDPNGEITIGRKTIRSKGSDLIGGHEYTHFADTKAAGVGELDPSKMSKREILSKASEFKDKLRNHANAKGITDIAKQAVNNTGINPNGRDADEIEIHADATSIATIPGNNNANRLRKTLHEMGRRSIQSYVDNNRGKIDIDPNDPDIKKNLNEVHKKRVETAVEYNKLKDKRNKTQ